MKLFKTYIIEIFYECGNRLGIELCDGAGIFPVQGATARCLGNRSPQVSNSVCTKSTTQHRLNWLRTWMIISFRKYCTMLTVFCITTYRYY